MLTFVLRRASEHKAARWSGGITTELYIHPQGASYAGRDFSFRISSATVTAEESLFTSLPGYERHIMPLSGQIHLEHVGQHTANLKPYMTDCFQGSWQTCCHGVCTDFNLMCAGGYKGSLHALAHKQEICCMQDGFAGILSQADSLKLVCSQQDGTQICTVLNKGDFLLAQQTGEAPVLIQALCESEEKTVAVVAAITTNDGV